MIKLVYCFFSVLSLFSVVRFANSFCYGSNGYNGTCLTSAECSTAGGTTSGSCASGFGVCCTSKFPLQPSKSTRFSWIWSIYLVLETVCGKTVTRNNTYWQNPGYSSAYYTAGQCSLYVKKCEANICQLRYSFNKAESSDFKIKFKI